MEEKINNQKIFSYIPSLIARLILNSNLQDKDIFSDNLNQNTDENDLNNIEGTKKAKGKSTFLTSLFINPSIYPINHYLPNTIVMNIRLKGFQRLISTLTIKDPKDQIEKMINEYLSIIAPKQLLKISEIISKNGGEIIKFNDYEFTTIWNYKPKKHKIPRYKKFYAKQALLSACEIMREIDNKEIVNGIKIKISIGIAMGKTMIGFFGGERKRGEYIVMGEAIHNADICLNYCLSHEIVISDDVNKLFIGSEEIITKEIENNENVNLYLVINSNENNLKNFKGFKIKMKYDKLNMTKTVYENLAKKVYIFSSILPQGLVKYLDVGQDHNLKEISVVTIATIHILIDKYVINDLKKIQNIILDIQKATYLTFGSLLYISKTYNGLLVRCVWGMDPGSFLDDTARCISTAILIGSLTKYYEIKIGIGISTGSCYTGLIPIQGDRKQFTLLGKKVNLSRTLADEAFQNVINYCYKRKYKIYCDKETMIKSQKWFRHIYISKINIYFDKNEQELHYEVINNNNNSKNIENNVRDNSNNNIVQMHNNFEYIIKNKQYKKKRRSNASLLGEYNRKNIDYFKKLNDINGPSQNKKIRIISIDIYSPVEKEEYFLQNINDPFPLLRTHKFNSYSPKINHYFYNHLQNDSFDNSINVDIIGNLPMLNIVNENEEKKMKKILEKSKNIYGYNDEINRFVNILNKIRQKNKKQILLIKGPLGVGKSLFLRNALCKYIDSNEELKKIYYNDDFFFFNTVDPLTVTFPYNIFCFILRKIYFYIKKINKLNEINNLCEKLHLDNDNIKNINFVLSMSKKDINIKEGFPNKEYKERDSMSYYYDSNNIMNSQTETMSVIKDLEGPHKIKDSNKIDNFFFEMIKIYKKHLNNKYKTLNKLSRMRASKVKNRIPLILVVDDIQMSDKYSMDFIRYLFNNDNDKINPFIIILVEQTPFSVNYRPILHRELEFFLSAFSDSDDDNDDNNIENDKIITFRINPFMKKEPLKEILIHNFNNYVIKNYKNSKLNNIDDKILDFLLMKTFYGNPLLTIELFDSLLKAQKFIELENNEFRITQELIDDNDVFDWSNLLLPYIYEKITCMTINSLLNFKEILLLKYACTIGTIFDVQTVDKINPLNLIIKKEEIINIMEKLSNEYIIELFENENGNRKIKKCLICKICFPFMREVLHKKFPIEQRAKLNAEIAKLLSGGKKVYYFNSTIEGKILNRHLIYSEVDIVKEIESKTAQDNLINSYKKKKIMNTNNLTVLSVKDICSRIFDRRTKNVIEGNLEALIENNWIKVTYFVDRQWKIHFKQMKEKKLENDNTSEIEIIIPIKDIFKNTILKNNQLEITISEYSVYILNENKETVIFRSDNYQDIFHFNTAITFLKMISIYEKYIYNFGYTKFPLYKKDWFSRKEKKYYANIEQAQLYYYKNNFSTISYRKKRFLSCFGLVNQTDKLINESKDINRPFNVIMRTSFSLIIALIQNNINKNKNHLLSGDEQISPINSLYLLYIPISEHIKKPIGQYLKELEKKRKEERELLKIKSKGKYSFFPLSLMRSERRMLGSGIFEERRYQSISQSKSKLLDNEKKENEIIEEKTEEKCNFKGRKNEKSRTVVERNEDLHKELENLRLQRSPNIEFVDNEDTSNNESKTISKTNDSMVFNESDSERSDENNENSCEKKNQSNKDNNNINNNKIKSRNEINENNIIKKDTLYSTITENNDKNNEDNYNSNIINDNNNWNEKNKNSIKINNNNDKKKVINFNKFNINNNKNQVKNNKKNNYNINNYINNNININLINNNYLNHTLKHSFHNKNIINNNYNININTLRMSAHTKEHKFLIKTRQKLNPKKSNSAKIISLKEKYRNSINYCPIVVNKISLDDDEYSITSDKESENNITNLFTSPQTLAIKKSTKIVPDIIPAKEYIFAKALNSIFSADEIKSKNTNKNNNSIDKYNKKKSNNNLLQPNNNIEINKEKISKRSSLCPGIKFQNKNKHVTFNQRKSEKIDDNYKKKKINENVINSDNNNNIKRIQLYDKND